MPFAAWYFMCGRKKSNKYVFLLDAAKARVSERKRGCLAVKRKIDINYIIVVFSEVVE